MRLTLTITATPDGRLTVSGLDPAGPTEVADVDALCELLEQRLGGAGGAPDGDADDTGGAPDGDADDMGGAPDGGARGPQGGIRPPVTGAPVDLSQPTPGPAGQGDGRAMWDEEARARAARPTGLLR